MMAERWDQFDQVLHRTLLQSMPEEWQERFVACLEELRGAFRYLNGPDEFAVLIRDARGRFAKDPIPHYDRGRTYLEPRAPADDPARFADPPDGESL